MLRAAQVPSCDRPVCVLVDVAVTGHIHTAWTGGAVRSHHTSRLEGLVAEGGEQGWAALVQVYFYLEGLRSSTGTSATRNKLLTRWLDMLGHMFCQHPSSTLSLWLLQKRMLLRQSSSSLKVLILLKICL